ncbi:hypothetical protein [Neisseria iguanae]|uniref:Uncharacterized protein n=1 Tax=Neisseria iguanae TaxID=90242 RepID=A0A2P7TYC0_9NEIS|nr:hypothetical protein [Neisseria iguanae]PSJ79730.1 hypothetical protein C7N83_10445 [Neisseria iguanae]
MKKLILCLRPLTLTACLAPFFPGYYQPIGNFISLINLMTQKTEDWAYLYLKRKNSDFWECGIDSMGGSPTRIDASYAEAAICFEAKGWS